MKFWGALCHTHTHTQPHTYISFVRCDTKEVKKKSCCCCKIEKRKRKLSSHSKVQKKCSDLENIFILIIFALKKIEEWLKIRASIIHFITFTHNITFRFEFVSLFVWLFSFFLSFFLHDESQSVWSYVCVNDMWTVLTMAMTMT